MAHLCFILNRIFSDFHKSLEFRDHPYCYEKLLSTEKYFSLKINLLYFNCFINRMLE